MISICEISMTSLITSMLNLSPASRSSLSPSRPMPWNEYGELRGLNAPPRKHAGTSFRDQFGDREKLFARFDRARTSHDDHFLAADLQAIGKLNDCAFGTERAAGELIRRADAMHLLDAIEHFEIARVKIGAGTDGREHGLAFTGGAVNGETHADQMFDYVLDLRV